MNRISQPTLVYLTETTVPNSLVEVGGSNLIEFRDATGECFRVEEMMTDQNGGYLECIKLSTKEKMDPDPTYVRSDDRSGLLKFVEKVARFVAN
jgi:hypothetical protein